MIFALRILESIRELRSVECPYLATVKHLLFNEKDIPQTAYKLKGSFESARKSLLQAEKCLGQMLKCFSRRCVIKLKVYK